MMILKTSRSNLSSNDQLSLDLPFAATKSLTARVGPTPTFSRASGATYIGSDGLIHGVDTSTTSNTIGTGSRTFTLAATAGQDQLWRAGDAVEASNGSNIMVGTVTSYNAATQSLVCNMTTASGTGTFTSWRIGYRGPRFDHTSAGVCRGLLIEEGRTNLATYSEDLALAFTVERASVLSNNATSPDGATTADKLVEDTTATNSHRLTRQLNLSAIPYTFSVFAKASERSWIRMTLFDGTTGRQVWFDVSAGTIGTQSGATGQIVSFGNGWWRCSITATGLAFVSSQANIALATADNISAYTGDGTSGLFLWGAQVEAGSFATSYIPTTTGSVVRSADVCSITTAGWSNAGNDTMVAEYFARNFLANAIVLEGSPAISWMSVSFTTENRQRNIYRHGGTSNRFDATSGTDSVSLTSINKTALTSGEQIALNGSLSQTVLSDPPQNDISTSLSIGSRGNGASFFLNGHIAAIRYYKKRLPNAKLQALTV
jgi:hypothetical protein